jgi:lactoylglutathione lyase
MLKTQGINHLGLSVKNLDQTVTFYTDCLGWEESGRDDSYPRSAVSDGNVGLHHFALEVASEAELDEISEKVSSYPGVYAEFMPELLVGARENT